VTAALTAPADVLNMSAARAREILTRAEVGVSDLRELVSAKTMLEDANAPRAPEPPVVREDPETAAAIEALWAARQPITRQLKVAHPVLGPEALYGLAGQIVRRIEPHSEADPAALLVVTLSTFGAMVGAGPHAVADGAEHPARIWALLAGETAKSRKGSASKQAERIPAMVDRRFMNERVLAGFGSGEALVDACAPHPGEEEAPHDPRLLVVESEFARILAVGKREGSTLSTLLRQGWDGSRLQVRSRAGSAVALNAHVVVIGHITKSELLARVAESDIHGGLLNRFLIVAAQRSKLLPGGGDLDDGDLADLSHVFANALLEARKVGILRRTPEAEEYWSGLYAELAADEPGGLLGAVIARDSAQVLRLSVAYALLDRCHRIEAQHVVAAEAVWRYCRASAAAIFGELTGDPIADRILAELQAAGSAGLTATEVSKLFGRNVSADRLDAARRLLISRGLAGEYSLPTAGRPRVVLRRVEKTDTLSSSISFLSYPPDTEEKASQDNEINEIRALKGITEKRVSTDYPLRRNEKTKEVEPPPLDDADVDRLFADDDEEES
jgi:hypothetical protein